MPAAYQEEGVGLAMNCAWEVLWPLDFSKKGQSNELPGDRL